MHRGKGVEPPCAAAMHLPSPGQEPLYSHCLEVSSEPFGNVTEPSLCSTDWWQCPPLAVTSIFSICFAPSPLMGNGALSSSSHPALVFLLTILCPEAIWGLQPLAICSSHERRNPEIPSVLEALCQETDEEEMYCTVSYFWEVCRPQSNLAVSLGVCVTLNKLFHFPY